MSATNWFKREAHAFNVQASNLQLVREMPGLLNAYYLQERLAVIQIKSCHVIRLSFLNPEFKTASIAWNEHQTSPNSPFQA